MRIRLHTSDFHKVKAPLLVVPVVQENKKFPKDLKFLKKYLKPEPEEILKRPDYGAKFAEKHLAFTDHSALPVIVFVGIGKPEDWNLEKVREFAGVAVKAARGLKANKLAIYWDEDFLKIELNSQFLIEIMAAISTANFRVREFLTKEEEPLVPLEKIHFLIPDASIETEALLETGLKLGDSVNLARRLAELPSNILTPARFVSEIKKAGKPYKWKFEILEQDELESGGLNALLAVAQGSEHKPALVIAGYKHKSAKTTVALVGKGVTFDTGGISIKPSKNMEEMKYDMCGAAAVLGTLVATSEANLPVNVIGVFPLVENMPSGSAIRPGDVVTSYSGKTVEIINTDAEGRLILADALSYVEKNYKPDLIVDLATLTGSVVVALGNKAAAIYATDPDLKKGLMEASTVSGERIWELPFWDDYQEDMKSKIADIRNIGSKPGGGSITAARFLKFFLETDHWAHLDIAGTAYGMPEKSYRPAGATGFGVRLLWHWLNKLGNAK